EILSLPFLVKGIVPNVVHRCLFTGRHRPRRIGSSMSLDVTRLERRKMMNVGGQRFGVTRRSNVQVIRFVMFCAVVLSALALVGSPARAGGQTQGPTLQFDTELLSMDLHILNGTPIPIPLGMGS